jgi:hypothetical protein
MGRESKDNSTGEIAVPLRYWWLKRIGIGWVMVLITLVIFQYWSLSLADRRYQALIDSARARGEPILPGDFSPAAGVPDSQNAALALMNAATAINTSQAFQDFEHDDTGDPLTASQRQLLETTIAANVKSLTLARSARALPDVDWKVAVRVPMMSTLLPHLNSQRQLARLLRASAISHHAQGDDHEAVEAVRDILNQVHAQDRGVNVLVVNMVGIGLTAIACDAVQTMAPGLNAEGSGAGLATSGTPATRAQVRELISELTDDERYRQGAVRSWHGERMAALDNARFIANGGGLFGVTIPRVFKPAIELDGIRAAKVLTGTADAARQTNWQAANATNPVPNLGDSQLEELCSLPSRFLLPSTSRAIDREFQSQTTRHVAALQLAVPLYRIDHTGSYPDGLQQLVPEYLPRLPADPYASDGRPMGYHRKPSPALYSVGHNGTDDGGTSLPTVSPSGVVSSEWECADVVFPLEPAPPATQPLPAVEDHQ